MTTKTYQPGSATSYDTALESGAPAANLSTDVNLYIGESNAGADVFRSLVKIDFSDIPSNAEPSSVTLSLWITQDLSAFARDVKVFRVLRDWVLDEATWNVYSTGNNWTTAGCGSDGNDADLSTVLATTNVGAGESVGTEIQFDIDTAEFKKLIDGTNTNYGFLIKADTEGNDLYKYDSSYSATAAERPKLVVEYTAGSDSFFAFF